MLDAVTWLSLPGSSCHLTNFSFFFPVFALGKRAAHRGMRYLPPRCGSAQGYKQTPLPGSNNPASPAPRFQDMKIWKRSQAHLFRDPAWC